MIALNEFKSLGLSITWALIDIGFKGDETFGGELSPIDILNYAASLLQQEVYPEEVAELAGELEQNVDDIDRYVKILSSQEGIDRNIEFQKWMVCYVNSHLKKNNNVVNGLVELGAMWIKLGMPPNAPYVFQGVNNNVSPADYYTSQNYERLLRQHGLWIEEQLIKLHSYNQK